MDRASDVGEMDLEQKRLMIHEEEMGQGKFLISVALLPLTSAAAPPPDEPPPTPDEHRYQCKSAVITPGRGETGLLIQFVAPTGTPPSDALIGFAGPYDGNVMTIQRIYVGMPGYGGTVKATGHCKIFAANGRIDGVACLGSTRTASYVAYFRGTQVYP
jgi:hypothetical protein